MNRKALLSRLHASDPGWPEWGELVDLVKLLRFKHVEDEHLGAYLTSGILTFAIPDPISKWPSWMPGYVSALVGLQADEYTMAGGYAEAYSDVPTTRGGAFSLAGNDRELGYPVIPIPRHTFPFQTNSSGALFHINKSLEVLYPDAASKKLRVLDTLDTFTRNNLRQVISGECWFRAYNEIVNILD